jgi:hypothetical protein
MRLVALGIAIGVIVFVVSGGHIFFCRSCSSRSVSRSGTDAATAARC